MKVSKIIVIGVLATLVSFPVLADEQEKIDKSESKTVMSDGQMPMMNAEGNMPMMMGQGNMPMMKMMQERHAMMQKHMMKMETHMTNIESLLQQLVELQKK